MSRALRWALAAVFLASAVLKLIDFQPTWMEIGDNLALADGAAQALVSALVVGEMALGGALAFEVGRERRVLAVTAGVMTLFLGVSAWLALRGVESCGCFGTKIPIGPGATAIKDALTLGVSLWLYRGTGARERPCGTPPPVIGNSELTTPGRDPLHPLRETHVDS